MSVMAAAQLLEHNLTSNFHFSDVPLNLDLTLRRVGVPCLWRQLAYPLQHI
jgi:hypothetical protein